MKKILLYMVITLLLLTACSDEPTYWGDIAGDDGEHIGLTLYGKYAEDIPENYVTHTEGLDELYQEFKVDAENIYEAVKVADLTDYHSPYTRTILEASEDGRFAAKTRIYINEVPIDVLLGYDIEERDGRWETGYVGVDPIYMNYFPEPIITISFSVPNVRNVYNSLLYTVDGELVGEYQEWFMFGEGCDETVRDELAEFYFNEALRIIGKD